MAKIITKSKQDLTQKAAITIAVALEICGRKPGKTADEFSTVVFKMKNTSPQGGKKLKGKKLFFPLGRR